MRSVEVDRDRCMASGLCSFYAPATFALDEHERSVVIDPEGDPPDAIDVAVEACPTQAISVGA
jgi:ferredoxin